MSSRVSVADLETSPLTSASPRCSSVGAGDTFVAGMLYGLVAHADDWDARQKVRFAVDLATLKVQREGFGGLGVDALRARNWS